MMKGLLFSASLCLEKCRFTVSGEQVQLNFNHGDSPVYSVNLSILSTCDLCLHRVYHAFQQWTSPWSNLKRVAVFASKKRFPWAPVTQRHANTPPETYLSWRSQKIGQILEEIGSHSSQSPGGRNLIYEASIFGCSGTKLAAKFMGIQGNSPPNATLTQETAGLIKRLFTTTWGGTLPIACWCNLDEWPLQHWLC